MQFAPGATAVQAESSTVTAPQPPGNVARTLSAGAAPVFVTSSVLAAPLTATMTGDAATDSVVAALEHTTPTFVTLTAATVPDPLLTVQVCAAGWVSTVTS